MSIHPFLQTQAFDPSETNAMGDAFEIICRLLSLKPCVDDALTRTIAKAIIEAAKIGVRDPEGLMAAALQRLGIPQRAESEKRPH